ncbi:hypothetical protein G195_001634 [Phytophthora kernoviae 00238/432]|uniref:Uncharacterized protein n=1 Tax=Phytophthora kernoviae 00238/432 TaxID=1284355 RepID=A0A8J4SG06_9STRA|nr:hypothetical protein G195_001634 [Phytophthora kernoviae 00238/432]
MRFVLGNVCSGVSLLMLLTACSGHKWARDAANSVDIGLWSLSGIGVRYKLSKEGANIDSSDVAESPLALYSRFCSLSAVTSSDPWCLSDAAATRVFVVLALLAAIISFVLSMMVAFNIKIPTWNGEGKEASLIVPVMCSLFETLALIPAVVLWQRMVNVYNGQCLKAMKITTFTCISSGSTHYLAIVVIPLTAATYALWRLSHSYYEAKRNGKIADGFTLAAKTDNVDEILSGIANKIDIDAVGSDGRNALHWACTLHRTSICHILLKKGASISMKDRDGWTPLHWASRVGNLDIVRLLAKYGANLNVQDRWGTTPLMLTIVGESKVAAETLIELGAVVDSRNVFGQTPLMLCAEGGTTLHQLGMVLLNAGSNLTKQDAQGMTALHYAAANGNVNLLMNMLQQCDTELVDKPNKVSVINRRKAFYHRLTRVCKQFGETLLYLANLHRQLKVLELVKNWREGNPIVASHDNDDDTDSLDNDSDDADSDYDSDGDDDDD